MTKIYLIRHCEAEGNACRFTQATSEGLVTRKGFLQCEALRKRFEGERLDAVYTSDLHRSIVTAEALAAGRGLTVKPRISFREICTGVWEGTSWGNIARDYPREFAIWSETPWLKSVPGGGDFGALGEMMLFGIRRVAKEIGPEGAAAVVSHSVSIKCFLCAAQGRPIEEALRMGHGDNTSVSLMEVDAEGNVRVAYTHDGSHLPPELRRGWAGVAGGDINMTLSPYRPEADREETVSLIRRICGEAGEPERAEALERALGESMSEHPSFAGISRLKGRVSGFILLSARCFAGLPAGTCAVRALHVAPELVGKGYGAQLFGYALRELRYMGFERIAFADRGLCAEERAVRDQFLFRSSEVPGADVLDLFTPPCRYPVVV